MGELVVPSSGNRRTLSRAITFHTVAVGMRARGDSLDEIPSESQTYESASILTALPRFDPGSFGPGL
jgi:hypothetical protein